MQSLVFLEKYGSKRLVLNIKIIQIFSDESTIFCLDGAINLNKV
jgi:hypothetical protein